MNSKRQSDLVDYINENEYVKFNELCSHFNVSTATMRRDLIQLEEQGLIERVHGGAKRIANQYEPTQAISQRLKHSIKEKIEIAEYAFTLIHENDSVILDASTTCLELAKVIERSNMHLTVITNYLAIANLLADSDTIDTIFIGGFIRKAYYSTSGNIAENTLKDLSANIAFIGVDGIDSSRGLANNLFDVVTLKQIIINNSSQTFVLADHAKFEKVAVLQIAPLSDVTGVITDSRLDEQLLQDFEDIGKIIRVSN